MVGLVAGGTVKVEVAITEIVRVLVIGVVVGAPVDMVATIIGYEGSYMVPY